MVFEKTKKIYMSHNKKFYEVLEKDYGTNMFKVLSFQKGERIEGAVFPERLYYIKKGVVVRAFNDYEGNRKALDVLMKDEMIGLSTLTGEIPVLWEMEVLEDVELIIIPSVILEKYVKDLYLIFALYSQYCLTELYTSWQAMLSEGSERINYAILFLCDKVGRYETAGYIFPEYINHNFIANFSAVSRSYVTRHISNLKKVGILSVNGRKICIVDIEKLKSLTPNYQTQ